MTSTLVIRAIESLDEVRCVEQLQQEAWGMDDRDLVPLSELVAVRDSGGQLLGAFDGPVLVGFVYGFVALDGGQPAHHSHLLAVKPAYRGADLGYRLKLAQRERVLAQGITRMSWTFDPLQSLNAHFNFRKLGVVSDSYKIDLYGDRSSSFLHRHGTDRLWVTWLLASDRVRRRLEAGPEARAALPRGRRLIEIDSEGTPHRRAPEGACSGDQALIDIPADIDSLQRHQPQRAMQWREATRGAFGEALASGYVVEEFIRVRAGGETAGTYLLSRRRTMADFR